jgi:hypothetical protein
MCTGLLLTRHWIRHWHVVGMFSCSPPIPWESYVLRVAIETAECPFSENCDSWSVLERD